MSGRRGQPAEEENADLRAQWARLGVDPDKARAAAQAAEAPPGEDGDEDYELPPELWPAWECFVCTWNQWRVIAGLVGLYFDGIDHTSLQSAMDMLGVKKSKRRDVFLHVRILESEAKPLRNQQD